MTASVDSLNRHLSPGAERLIEAAKQRHADTKHLHLGVTHWLLTLVERHGAMAEYMAQDLSATVLAVYLREELRQNNAGEELDADRVIDLAVQSAQNRGRSEATERDIAAVILTAAGYPLRDDAFPPSKRDEHQGSTSEVDQTSGGAFTGATAANDQVHPTRPTPALEKFGRDLTRSAMDGKLNAMVGRELEVQMVVEILCRRTKRNPVLVGPAGVGKTAIVEGLAQRIVQGQVPEALRGVRVIEIQPSAVVAGASMFGELNERMKALVAEASQDGIVLFVDEVHSLVGMGGASGTADLASLLKPALARGDLACIAATTDEEYRRFVEPDAALERRFQPIRIQELTPEQTRTVLLSLRDELSDLRQVSVGDDVLKWLIDFASEFLHNRTFPDKAVDLLEQCVAYAMTQGKEQVTLADAETVAQRVVGMPLGLSDRIGALQAQIVERGLLPEEDAQALIRHLAVTMRGLDIRSSRPNAVVLLIGSAVPESAALSSIMAETLFGSPDRVLTIDFSRFTHPEDVSMLIGAPPGYVGYNDDLPLYHLKQMPWCVVRCENLQSCHPYVLQLVGQAVADGVLTDARGERIYLSDTVVLLSLAIDPASHRTIGFQQPGETATVATDTARSAAEDILGAAFVDQVDLIWTHAPSATHEQRQWLRHSVLADLAQRYGKQGVELRYDDSILDWLLTQKHVGTSPREWERVMDNWLSPELIRHLPTSPSKGSKVLVVSCHEGHIDVEVHQTEGQEA